MGWRDRDYARHDYEPRPPEGYRGPARGMSGPKSVVAKLVIVNVVVFVVEMLWRGLADWFAVIPALWWQAWRYVTFQFLHASFGHIFFNMLALYFLGMYLERDWGAKRFLRFYLSCGVIGGVLHVLMTPILNQPTDVRLIGASGGVFGVLLACAVFYPHIKLYLYFLFPVPIRLVAAIFLGIGLLNVIVGVRAALEGGRLAGGISHPAHLGGAAAAVVWIWVVPRLRRRPRPGARPGEVGNWEKKLQQRRRRQQQVDAILDKIRAGGIGSLSRREKRFLREATDQQRREDELL